MALLNILRFPDPRLRTVAKPVEKVDKKIRQLIENMYETMHKENGVGLAATQVNIHKRVVVTNCHSGDRDDETNESTPITFINPVITFKSDEIEKNQEGCLSVPEIYADVDRAKVVKVKALNENGETFELECRGLLAICIQHEIDHLNGKLFVDYLSPAKRSLIRNKMKKYEKEQASHS